MVTNLCCFIKLVFAKLDAVHTFILWVVESEWSEVALDLNDLFLFVKDYDVNWIENKEVMQADRSFLRELHDEVCSFVKHQTDCLGEECFTDDFFLGEYCIRGFIFDHRRINQRMIKNLSNAIDLVDFLDYVASPKNFSASGFKAWCFWTI